MNKVTGFQYLVDDLHGIFRQVLQIRNVQAAVTGLIENPLATRLRLDASKQKCPESFRFEIAMIDHHEIAVLFAARVNEACQIFTPTAGLSEDQDGGVVLGGLLSFLP